MAQVWDADVELPAGHAAAIIGRQFPHLAPARLELLGVGWDNTAYRVNGAYVFRFPRRKVGAELLNREVRLLPLLAPHLPLPVPNPCFAGEPAGAYPYPFAGYAHLCGATACQVPWTDPQRRECAVPLAHFLSALHAVPVDAETRKWAPGDDIFRADTQRRLPHLLDRLASLREVAKIDVATLQQRARELAETPAHSDPGCWVHGDLYPRHLLVNARHQPCGVIDWGDVHLGDPALDLSIAFTFLPPSAWNAFRAAYGGVDAPAWRRAEFRALFYGTVLWHYGTETGDHAIRGVGEYALRNVLRGL